MTRTFYVNGEFVAEADAKISVLDRGFLFADAVYEVSTVSVSYTHLTLPTKA